MRVAVTGASGFTGRYLLPELYSRDHEVVILKSNLASPVDLKCEIAAAQPEAIIHLAAKAFVHLDDFEEFYAVNQIGSFHLLAAAAAEVPGARVLLASSAQVYGVNASGVIDESFCPKPANHYALSKLAMEMGSNLWSDRLNITIVRPFNYTGIGQGAQFLVPKVVDHFRRRAPVIELGNIDIERDFGDVRSVVSAYADLIGKTEMPEILNVCTGQARSVRSLISALTQITGHKLQLKINQAFVRANDVPLLVGNGDLLRKTLPDWRPLPFEETLAWMVAAQ